MSDETGLDAVSPATHPARRPRTYRLVTRVSTNGLGTLEMFSTPVRVFGDPFYVLNQQRDHADVYIDRVEEFIDGHWWKAAS